MYKRFENSIVCCMLIVSLLVYSCGSKSDVVAPPPSVDPKVPTLNNVTVDGVNLNNARYNISLKPQIKLSFSQPLAASSLNAVSLVTATGSMVSVNKALSNNDSAIILQPVNNLSFLTRFNIIVNQDVQSVSGGTMTGGFTGSFVTKMDSSRKFPKISDEALFDTVQRRTLKYFWDFAHPVSGLIREGTKHDSKIVTTGGSGFGIMALLVAAERGFKTKAEVLHRLQTMIAFLKNTAQHFHGVYPHWLDGSTGEVIPFSSNDNGADLVETAFLVQGLLCARQYFDGMTAEEVQLRDDINTIVNRVQWNWFQKENDNVLYWHWSPTVSWAMNLKIQGWNECLLTYVLAAGSENYSIAKSVYDNGWAQNGGIRNGTIYYGYTLPLGPNLGGPLFFAHYSFLGLKPYELSDAYADYWTQNRHHTLINYNYCKANPKDYYGYSDSVWGLTASNIRGGYAASSPSNDLGYIAPTAAISSMPYTPEESLAALHFYYYVLGDKLFKEYGFVDAFTLDVMKNDGPWFDDAFLAIDQGPIIVMIENYRSGLLWNLFMSAPEVKNGLSKLGFNAPGL